MKTTKQGLLGIAAAGLLIGSAAGCSPGGSGQSASGDETSGAEITVAIEATGDIPQEFQAQVDRFNDSNDRGINVSILTYAGSEAYETAITGQIAGKSAPDVIWLDGGKKIQEYAENEAIIGLDDLLGDITGDFEPSLLEAFVVDGALFGIPKDYNTSVLFYQTDRLAEAGVEVPATIADFKEVVGKLTGDGSYGFGVDPKINYLYPFMATMGADFIEADGSINEAKLRSGEHAAALTMFKDMFDAKQATSPYLDGAGWDGELFANGTVNLLYGGSWITGVVEDPSSAGVAPLPVQNGPYSMLYTAGWAISSQSSSPDAAAEFIRFLSSPEELVKGNLSGLIGLPPTGQAMADLIEAKADDPFLPVYAEVVKDGIPFGLLDGEFVDQYNKALENLFYNNASVEESIESMIP